MDGSFPSALPIFLAVACASVLAIGLLIVARIFNPDRSDAVERMPYESGMDPIHDTRRRFDVRFYLLAVAFLVFDVELLFLYPWAVAWGGAKVESRERRVESERSVERGEESGTDAKHSMSTVQKAAIETANSDIHSSLPSPLSPLPSHLVFAGAMTFLLLLTLGFIYDWRKGVFQWL
jgi:NADH-quinone oxidoreductase subunit A